MEQYGNKTTYNLEGVLQQNIVNSEYWKEVQQLTTWSEVVDEIYNEVSHCEPWMSGNARGPSTAFCLLYRLFTMKISVGDIYGLLDHGDSPYIRAIGFLYLRYVADPKTLWSWCERYVKDEEEIQPEEGGKTVTVGDFIRDILLEQYYFDTIFPRIPEVAKREIQGRLAALGLPSKGVGGGGTGTVRRSNDEPMRRPPSVKAALSVNLGQRAPHRAGAREAGRGIDPTMNSSRGSRESHRPSPSPPPKPDRSSERRGSPRERRRSPEGRREREERGGYRGGSHDRDRDYDRRDERDRRDRDDRERRDGERRDRDDRERRDRDRDRDRMDRDRRDRERRSRSRSRERRSGRDDRDSRDRGRDRGAREREEERHDSRGASSVFKESAAAAMSKTNLDTLKSMYGDNKGLSSYSGGGSKDSSNTEVVRLGKAGWK